jgi:hypothetical protein
MIEWKEKNKKSFISNLDKINLELLKAQKGGWQLHIKSIFNTKINVCGYAENELNAKHKAEKLLIKYIKKLQKLCINTLKRESNGTSSN